MQSSEEFAAVSAPTVAQSIQTTARALRAVGHALRGQQAAFEACRKSVEALQQAQEALQQAQEGLQSLALAETVSNTSEHLDALQTRLWGRAQGSLFDGGPPMVENVGGPLDFDDLGPLAHNDPDEATA